MKRDVTQTIWRTVVFAGAMLGAPACSKKHANTTPANTTAEPAATETTTGSDAAKPEGQATQPTAGGDTSSADPCGGGERPRGADDDGGGGVGRGFILS